MHMPTFCGLTHCCSSVHHQVVSVFFVSPWWCVRGCWPIRAVAAPLQGRGMLASQASRNFGAQSSAAAPRSGGGGSSQGSEGRGGPSQSSIAFPAVPLHVDVAMAAAEKRRSWHSRRSLFLGTLTGNFTMIISVGGLLVIAGSCVWMAIGCGKPETCELYDATFENALWLSWGIFFDPGTQTGIPSTEDGGHKLVVILFSFLGFILNLIFLGLVVEKCRTELDSWRRIHGKIVANGHTVVLGWTDKTLFLLGELADMMTDSAEGAGNIVVLGDLDPIEMRMEVVAARRITHGHAMHAPEAAATPAAHTRRPSLPPATGNPSALSFCFDCACTALAPSTRPPCHGEHGVPWPWRRRWRSLPAVALGSGCRDGGGDGGAYAHVHDGLDC